MATSLRLSTVRRTIIATAPRFQRCVPNDIRLGWLTKWVRVTSQGLFKVVEINRPLVLSLSKDGCRWFDKLTMSGGRRTLKRRW